MAGFFKLLSDLLFKPHYPSAVREQLRKRYREIRYHEGAIKQLKSEIESIKRSYEDS